MIVDGEKLGFVIEAIPLLLTQGTCGEMKKKVGEIREHLLSHLRECELPIQPPARIEAAIRYFDERHMAKATNRPYKLSADLLRWVLGQEQDTWSDADFGLEPEGACPETVGRRACPERTRRAEEEK